MSLPLFRSTPSERLMALLAEEEPAAPTYQEIGTLFNVYKTGTNKPTLKEFGEWLTGTGAYEGTPCQVSC
jgi:hypothetical protein